MGTPVSLHPSIKPCPLLTTVILMAKRSPVQHAAETRVFRNDVIRSPICWRQRQRHLMKTKWMAGAIISEAENKWKSYQFYHTKVPWQQDGNNPWHNALWVSNDKTIVSSLALPLRRVCNHVPHEEILAPKDMRRCFLVACQAEKTKTPRTEMILLITASESSTKGKPVRYIL